MKVLNNSDTVLLSVADDGTTVIDDTTAASMIVEGDFTAQTTGETSALLVDYSENLIDINVPVFAEDITVDDLTVSTNLSVTTVQATSISAYGNIDADSMGATNITITNEVKSDTLDVTGEADVGSLVVDNDADIEGNLTVDDTLSTSDFIATTIDAGAAEFDSIRMDTALYVNVNDADRVGINTDTPAYHLDVNGQIGCAIITTAGNANVGADLDVDGESDFADDVVMHENLSINDNLTVEDTIFCDDYFANGVLSLSGVYYLNFIGDLLYIGEADIQIAETVLIEKDLTVEGNLSVGGDSTLGGDVSTDGHILVADNISVGTASPSSSFRGVGDIYATSNVKAMEGLFAECGKYGAGLEISEHGVEVTYTNVMTGNAYLTASSQIITDPDGSFDDTYVNQFVRIISSTPDFKPSSGEIKAVLSSTELFLSFGTAGTDTIVDATDMRFVVYPHPIAFIGDNGVLSLSVGENPDAKLEVHSVYGNAGCSVDLEVVAGVEGHAGVCLDLSINGNNAVAASRYSIDASSLTVGENMTIIDVIVDRGVDDLSATGGSFAVIDMALAGLGNFDEATIIETGDNEVDIIHQHIGVAGTVDRTLLNLVTNYDLTDSGVNTTVLLADDDYVYIGSSAEFKRVEWVFSTVASASIFQTGQVHEYWNGASWASVGLTDDTSGFTGNGAWRNFGTVTGWTANDPNTEGTSYYYIRVQRTRNNVSTLPVVNLVTLEASSNDMSWDSKGDVILNDLTVSGGNLFITSIPTADPSVAGAVYSDSGTLKISAG